MGAAVAQAISESEVLISKRGQAGIITLNRPKALNSLNLEMIRTIMKTLKQWERDDQVVCVIIEGAGDKAFCAGGDIRSVYLAKLEGRRDYKDAIFREEYELNYYISKYSKPYISLVNGICMGGGLGISVHGAYRVVTEKTIMAMPETGIGFFPDVGASYFLNKCPGSIGMFMAITGEKITGADALYCGLATQYVSTEKIEALREALTQITSAHHVPQVIAQFIIDAPASELADYQSLIDEIFTGKTAVEVLDKLYQAKHPKAYEWVRNLAKKSPLSMAIAFTLLKRARGRSLKRCLPLEFRLSQRFVEHYDFFEGIRALLVDKDNDPKWQPNHMSKVTRDMIRSYFKDLGLKELKMI
ncbi:MAG: enoyl-CoA hydratase/isomerase family protein [Candidatus Paracaedibacteraceae bacterium]|nr:enoyl-CoA hydratase/isomerase family protein [Candidatus Paracaedibacteraceae bacterium]